jgi:hypothetical protein
MAEQRKPDAIVYPPGYLPGGLADRLLSANQVFGPTLGSARVDVADQVSFNFARPFPGRDLPGLLFPDGHRLAKSERHRWFKAERLPDGKWVPVEAVASFSDHGGKVLLGYLIPEDEAAPAAPAGMSEEEILGKNRQLLSDPATAAVLGGPATEKGTGTVQSENP